MHEDFFLSFVFVGSLLTTFGWGVIFFRGVVGWEIDKFAILYYVVPTGRLALQQLHCSASRCSGSLDCIQPILLAVNLAVE